MNRSQSLLVVTFILCITAGFALFVMTSLEPETKSPLLTYEDLSSHPIYSTYRFSPGDKTVRIGIQPFWVYGANIAEALRHDRLLAAELEAIGMQVEFHSFLKGPDINYFMTRDQLDVGMSGYLPTLKMTTLKNTLVPATIDRNYFDIIARNSLTIRDLEGKKIGFTPGSDAHHALVEALELTGTTARLIPLNIDAIVKAMGDGQIDACVSWEPITSQLLSENWDAHVVYRSRWITFLYFRGDFAETHPRAVHSLMAAQARAIRWINSDSDNLALSSSWAIDACRQLLPDSPPFSLPYFIKWSRQAGTLSNTSRIFTADLDDGQFLHNAFTFMQKQELISADAQWQKTRAMFDTQQLASILENPDEWRLNTFDYAVEEQRP